MTIIAINAPTSIKFGQKPTIIVTTPYLNRQFDGTQRAKNEHERI
jgi:hypothetical protein